MTVYAHIEDGNITGVYDTLPKNWRNISNFSALKDETEFLSSLGWRLIIKDTSEYDSSVYKQGNPSYTIVEDTVVETIPLLVKPQPVIVSQPPLTDEQLLEGQTLQHENVMNELRIIRDRLLAETDFTQLTDVIRINGSTLTQQYDSYRQLLRDLPAQYESDVTVVDISQIVFPTKPESE